MYVPAKSSPVTVQSSPRVTVDCKTPNETKRNETPFVVGPSHWQAVGGRSRRKNQDLVQEGDGNVKRRAEKERRDTAKERSSTSLLPTEGDEKRVMYQKILPQINAERSLSRAAYQTLHVKRVRHDVEFEKKIPSHRIFPR